MLQHRPQHFADHILERIDCGSGRDGRGDGLKLLEGLAALTGNLLVDQRRAEISGRCQRLVELENVFFRSPSVLGERFVLAPSSACWTCATPSPRRSPF